MCMSEHASLKSFEFSAKYNSLFDSSLKKGSIEHINRGDSVIFTRGDHRLNQYRSDS